MILSFELVKLVFGSILALTLYFPAIFHIYECYEKLSKIQICLHALFYPLLPIYELLQICNSKDWNNLKHLQDIYSLMEVPTKLLILGVFLLNNHHLNDHLNIFSYFNTIVLSSFYGNSFTITNISLVSCAYYIMIIFTSFLKYEADMTADIKVLLMEYLHDLISSYYQLITLLMIFTYLESYAFISFGLAYAIFLGASQNPMEAYKMLFNSAKNRPAYENSFYYIMVSRTAIYSGNLIICLIILNSNLFGYWSYSKFCVLSNRQANYIIISLLLMAVIISMAYYYHILNFQVFSFLNIFGIIFMITILTLVVHYYGKREEQHVYISYIKERMHAVTITTIGNSSSIYIQMAVWNSVIIDIFPLSYLR